MCINYFSVLHGSCSILHIYTLRLHVAFMASYRGGGHLGHVTIIQAFLIS